MLVHHHPKMLSIQSVYLPEDLPAWASALEVVVQPKIDGVALALYYWQGRLSEAALRGDGWRGQVIPDADRIDGIPSEIRIPGRVVVWGEVCYPLAVPVHGHRRAMASAALRAGRLSGLAFVAHGCPSSDVPHEYRALLGLHSEGFTIVPTDDGRRDIRARISETLRSHRPWQTDGAVVKVASRSAQREMGETARCPRWAVAAKWSIR